MVGKRVQFDDETWQAIQAVTRQTGKSFQELASAAFADKLKKHDQPVGFKAALEASVTSRSKVKRATNSKKPRKRRGYPGVNGPGSDSSLLALDEWAFTRPLGLGKTRSSHHASSQSAGKVPTNRIA